MKIEWSANWDNDLGGSPDHGDKDVLLKNIAARFDAGVPAVPHHPPTRPDPGDPSMIAAETTTDVGTVDLLLWVVFPYVCLAVFAVGHFWRYRYHKFGWTTRSSRLYENRLLRLGSPLFHFGLLFVILGHVMGLGVPKSWTEKAGISEGMYHACAVSVGSVAGVCTVVGMAILIYRRRTVGAVFSATTRMDKAMYAVLGTVIILGLTNTVVANVFGHYDYRDGVSIWFRGIFLLDPHPALMAAAPIGFKLHGLAAFCLFALWPFTRLVHVFSAPPGYLTRPSIVYRSRDDSLGSRKPARGWERVGS